MPLIQVNMLEGRPPEKVKELIENITDTVSETLGCSETKCSCTCNGNA